MTPPFTFQNANANGGAVFILKPDGWSFTLGTNTVDSVYVSSSGTIALEGRRRMTSPHGHVMPDTSGVSFLAPFWTSLGIVPEANWHLLPGGADSLFWHDVTQRGSTRFTWRNALLGRSANAPVSFQAELFGDGGFTFRYDLGTNAMPAAFAVGAQSGPGAGLTALASLPGLSCTQAEHACASVWRKSADGTPEPVPVCAAIGGSRRFELRWESLAGLGLEERDPDGDGLSTFEEIMVHGTDPLHADSDLDGIDDSSEIASGGDPRNPDGDGDGVPDGLTLEEWLAHPLFANATNAANVTISLLEPIPEGCTATLRIRDLVLPLSQPRGWDLRLSPGVEYDFMVLSHGNPFVKLSATHPGAAGAAFVMPEPEAGTAGGAESQMSATPVPAAAAQTLDGGDAGAFVIDDPQNFFRGGSNGAGAGSMGFVKIGLDDAVWDWSFRCYHDAAAVEVTACSPGFAKDWLEWSAHNGTLDVDSSRTRATFMLWGWESHGSVFVDVNRDEALFGSSSASISFHRHSGPAAICMACGYFHGSDPGCWHTTGCEALSGITAECTCAPAIIRVNSDDDDLNGVEDRRQTVVADGEDDFLMFRIPDPKGCYDYCHCSNANSIYWEVASISGGLRLRVDGEIAGSGAKLYSTNSLAIEALSASASFGSDWIEFEIHDESKEPDGEVLRRITRRYTAANAQIKPDRDGDGVVNADDARLAAGEPTVWRVARREDPYLLALQNECPGDMTPSVYLGNDVPCPTVLIGVGNGSTVIVPGGSADTDRDTTVNAWLDASRTGTVAVLRYGIVTPENLMLYSDELTIKVIDLSLPEQTISYGQVAEYDLSCATDSIDWKLSRMGETICTSFGGVFSSPPDLPPGEYAVSAHVHDIVGAPHLISAPLKVINVDIEQDEINLAWTSSSATLNLLSSETYLGGGSVVWTVTPSAGLSGAVSNGSAFMFSPTNSAPGEYTIRATSSTLPEESDVCIVRIVKVNLAVNKTPSLHDDIVCRYSTNPEGRPVITNLISLAATYSAPISVRLSGPKIRFGVNTEETQELILPANGDRVEFITSGQIASHEMGDAILEVSLADSSNAKLVDFPMTVLWVDAITIRAGQDEPFSDGNNALLLPVPTLLGAQIITDDTSFDYDLPRSLGLVCEFTATAKPANFTGGLSWGRDGIDDFLAVHSSDQLFGVSGTNSNLGIARELPQGNDMPPPETQDGYCDGLGIIYNWDCPGLPTRDVDPISNFPEGTLVFIRQNFIQFVTYGGVRCSDDFAWWMRVGGRKLGPVGNGVFEIYARPGHANDNSAGMGATTMTLD